jgi:hypothetical protein
MASIPLLAQELPQLPRVAAPDASLFPDQIRSQLFRPHFGARPCDVEVRLSGRWRSDGSANSTS